LSDDIALNLAATNVRIEAPIPGKSAVGIEIPNTVKNSVSMRELIDTPDFTAQKSILSAGLGKDIAGNTVYCDIANASLAYCRHNWFR
jgi:S-DNA-T family DNA segregation ATPase FtsK/SpoIIIE